LDTVQANGGTIPGENYQTLIAKGSPLSIASKSTNSTEKHFAIQIREALDDAFQRSAGPKDFAALKEARSQYKAMKTIEPLVNAGIPGQISQLRLQTVANRSYSNGAFTGRGDLGDIADIAQQYLKQPPDSGTPSRTLINNTFYGDAKGYGLKAAGAVAGRLAGTITNRPAVAPPGGFNLPAAIALAMQNRLNPGQ
jgi:hypothetical protein